ncbi:hypothetical protein [Metabacillus rhizolycopersici]|uniref:Uncharacterized protein n=1 Tax=Metabacillus rhizolycopersici TaxID=2875709 RepID=A0ABS7UR44_9BACI|nr:hypothetical protein [Metabacillus rhizolycopersici]MBZ5750787.1 hypothetical protein [Metabacillus rhizolycopersici]
MIIGSLIQILLLIIIIAIIYKGVNAIKRGTLLQKLNLKLVLGVYGALLLVAVVLFYLLPIEESLNKVVENQEELAKAERAGHLLINAASEGKQIEKENIDGVLIKKQWDFPYEGKQLEITQVDEQYSSAFILVERKDVEDNQVEVTQYYTRTIIENIELTDDIVPFTIELEEERLTISDTNMIDIHVGKFAKEFTISQFTSRNGIDLFSDVNRIGGENVLYIRVPKNVEVEGAVQFVTE